MENTIEICKNSESINFTVWLNEINIAFIIQCGDKEKTRVIVFNSVGITTKQLDAVNAKIKEYFNV